MCSLSPLYHRSDFLPINIIVEWIQIFVFTYELEVIILEDNFGL